MLSDEKRKGSVSMLSQKSQSLQRIQRLMNNYIQAQNVALKAHQQLVDEICFYSNAKGRNAAILRASTIMNKHVYASAEKLLVDQGINRLNNI